MYMQIFLSMKLLIWHKQKWLRLIFVIIVQSCFHIWALCYQIWSLFNNWTIFNINSKKISFLQLNQYSCIFILNKHSVLFFRYWIWVSNDNFICLFSVETNSSLYKLIFLFSLWKCTKFILISSFIFKWEILLKLLVTKIQINSEESWVCS